MENKLYDVFNTTTPHPSNKNFELHTHDNYEVYLFIDGDTNYIVEGDTYALNPYDIIVIRKNDMHRAYHNSAKRYQRYVISIWPEFFEKNNCRQYEQQFLCTGLGNKISSALVMSEGIYDAFMRLEKYTDGFKDIESPVAVSIITEILYLISNTEHYMGTNIKNQHIANVIEYINKSFTDNITLDELEKRFFVSKHYLCRSFKKATGLTVHQYITQKRMSYIKELTKEGKNITEAASLAGFNSYSSFYRAYKEKFDSSPKSLMKS